MRRRGPQGFGARADFERDEILLGYKGEYRPIGAALTDISTLAGRPVMITEWSFPAFDSGLPCSRGAGQRLDTQLERARASALYARKVLELPCVVGYDYFMWVDMPAKGISYGYPEDTNYGLIREDGTAYNELTQALASVQKSPRSPGTDPVKLSELAAAEVRADNGGWGSHTEGGAVMRTNVYCGNLLGNQV